MLLSDRLCFSVPFVVAFQSYNMKDWLVSCQCKVNALLCLLIFFKLIYVCTLLRGITKVGNETFLIGQVWNSLNCYLCTSSGGGTLFQCPRDTHMWE